MGSSDGAALPRRALLSVAAKEDLGLLPERLAAHGVALLATGRTAAALRARGLEVTTVEDYTGSGEMLGGRVKTLHPRIHAGILARAADEATIARDGILPIDLVAVTLYPFEETLARRALGDEVTDEDLVEEIDIGGVALLRAAAKNHARVTVLSGAQDFAAYAERLARGEGAEPEERRRLAARAFARTAYYDALIARAFAPPDDAPVSSETALLALRRLSPLRYGENPHQRAALYHRPGEVPAGVAHAARLQGPELSYNNYFDADTAWRAAAGLARPAAVIVKHAAPCGAALGESPSHAWDLAHAADPVSAFGGVVALNRPLDASLARRLTAGLFLELVLAPEVTDEARAVLARRPRLRVLRVPPGPVAPAPELRRIDGGYLLQEGDRAPLDDRAWRTAGRREVPGDRREDLLLAWWIVRFLPSNAIALVRDGATVGLGGGQPNRVDAVRIAVERARRLERPLAGAVLASDAFFPFPDALEEAAQAGIEIVVQPGGSKRDPEVVAAADRLGIAMIFTGERHFRH
jgi:phosphoribosylaminoimidazolecarboxamide formyltransferase/IMP cyclohydrolase